MTDIWTDPIDRVLRELISPSIWNTNIAANLRLLKQHGHTGVDGDGALHTPFLTNSGAMAYFTPQPPYASADNTGFAANTVYVSRFFLPIKLSVGSLTAEVTTLSAASTLGLGIYNKDGTSLLCSGTASSASTGAKRISITPTVLDIGFYLLAWTCTSAVVVCRGFSNVDGTVMNNTNTQKGTGANASAVGVLPSTTGAISAVSVNQILAKLEGS